MSILVKIIIANLIISLIALAGIFTLVIKEKALNKILLILVSLSAGVLMGGAFFHLIPEQLKEGNEPRPVMVGVIIGFIIFYIIEKILHWRHCHKDKCSVHSFAYINLVGDSIHNFLDGMIIAAAFIANPSLGLVTVIAVAMHEIPQEIGDFGVLVYGGFNRIKALYLNFLTALTAVAGGIIGYALAGQAENITSLILPFAAGGFIYIAASDLLPEIKKEADLKKFLGYLTVFIIGIILMYSLGE